MGESSGGPVGTSPSEPEPQGVNVAISVSWVGEAVVDCDGRFEQSALLSRSGSAADASIGVSSVGGVLVNLRVRPTTIKDLGSTPRSVRITGRLSNPCEGGTLALSADGEPFGRTVNPNAVSAKLNGVEPKALQDGSFNYTLALRCCAPGAGNWDILHDAPMCDNIATSAPSEQVLPCPGGAQPLMVLVNGRLADPGSAGEDVYGLSRNNNIVCKVKTKIRPWEPKERRD